MDGIGRRRGPTTEIYVRVSDGLLERLELKQEAMSRDRPGAVITMSEVVRTGLIRWLTIEEDDE